MTLTFELDLDTVKTTQQAVYLGHKSFRSKVIARTDRQTDRHTHRTDRSTRSKKVVGNWRHIEWDAVGTLSLEYRTWVYFFIGRLYL